MKQLLLTSLLVFLALPLWAQEEGETATPAPAASATRGRVQRLENWNVGISLVQWSEELRLRQFGVTTNSIANLSGFIISVQKDYTYVRWGWSMGAHIGAGKANGGSPGFYEQNKIAFTMLGASARAFYRLSGRINFGTTLMIFNRVLEWPDDTTTNVTAESGKNPNVMAMGDLNLRLAKDWELYQGLGHVGEGGTLWRIGLNYRF
ncbi:hypothetical protein [Bdellovibrio sp. HCB2-146]|uniref:hypothetical protein n=1 Tax=Bdellovibrio sp. HCB2-146 TaxID=3394362 RepID=UPI0039BC65CA